MRDPNLCPTCGQKVMTEPKRATRCLQCGGIHMPGTDHQPRNGLASNPDAIAAMRNLIAGAKRPLPKETA